MGTPRRDDLIRQLRSLDVDVPDKLTVPELQALLKTVRSLPPAVPEPEPAPPPLPLSAPPLLSEPAPFETDGTKTETFVPVETQTLQQVKTSTIFGPPISTIGVPPVTFGVPVVVKVPDRDARPWDPFAGS